MGNLIPAIKAGEGSKLRFKLSFAQDLTFEAHFGQLLHSVLLKGPWPASWALDLDEAHLPIFQQ